MNFGFKQPEEFHEEREEAGAKKDVSSRQLSTDEKNFKSQPRELTEEPRDKGEMKEVIQSEMRIERDLCIERVRLVLILPRILHLG